MLVDTAAQHGCIGRPQLTRIESALKGHGLKVKWTSTTPETTGGIGGSATVVGHVQIPVGFGGLRGIIECSVLEQDVPGLIPIGLLKTLGAKIDCENNFLSLKNHNQEIPLINLPSRHIAINVLAFPSEGWSVPDSFQLPDPSQYADFHCEPASAYMACSTCNSDPPCRLREPVRCVFTCHSNMRLLDGPALIVPNLYTCFSIPRSIRHGADIDNYDPKCIPRNLCDHHSHVGTSVYTT